MSATSPDMERIPPAGRRPPRRPAVVAGSFIAVVLVVLFALVFGRLRASQTQAQMPPGNAALPLSGRVPASWQTYQDPAGYFTIRVPSQWQASASTGQSTMGDRTGSFSTQDEYVSIGTNVAFLLGTGVGVDVQPAPNDYARQWMCRNQLGPLNTTLGGLPASYESWTWFLDTHAAHYQVSTSFPGGGSPHSSPAMPANQPLPTPVAPATAIANEHLIELVVSTFQPIPATPLVCSS